MSGMFVLRLGRSSCSFELNENMPPPNKKLKTSETGNEEERETLSKEVESLKDFGADWRAECRSVRDINRYILKKEILKDVTFHVGEKPVEIHAHRMILAFRSPVFEAMFYGALADKRDIITIPDIAAEGFRGLMRFIYFDDISFQSDVNAFQIYFAADKYCVSHLKDMCDKYLCTCELMPSNVWIHFESSQYLNSQRIMERCLHFLQYKTEDALGHASFLDVGPKTLETLLCMDILSISEMKLLLNVVRWAENNSNSTPESSLQSTLKPFLRFIRFGSLTSEEFITFLDTQKLKNLLTDKDALDILKHINKPTSCALPEWCCTKLWRNRGTKKSKCCPVDIKPKDFYCKDIGKLFKQYTHSHSNSSSSSSSSSSESESDSDSDSYSGSYSD